MTDRDPQERLIGIVGMRIQHLHRFRHSFRLLFLLLLQRADGGY